MKEGAAPRRLSIREVLREAYTTYRSNFWPLLATAQAVFIPIGLLEFGVGELERLDDGSGLAAATIVGGALAFAASATLGDVFYTGVVAALVGQSHGRRRRGLGELARSLPYGRLIAVDLLLTLMIALGVLALVVPGVVVLAWFGLAPAVVEIEGRGVREAFRRSRELVRAHFWPVLGLLATTLILGDASSEGLQLLPHELFGEGNIVEAVGTILAEVVTAPLYALVAVVCAHQLIELRGAGRG